MCPLNDSKLPKPELASPGFVQYKRLAGCNVVKKSKAIRPFLSPFSPLSLSSTLVMGWNNLPENFTNITNNLAEKPSIATLATVLLSFTGIQDWLKLFLLGGVLETCRRVVLQAWQNILDSIWISVDFEEGDDSYGGSFHDLWPLAPRAITPAL